MNTRIAVSISLFVISLCTLFQFVSVSPAMAQIEMNDPLGVNYGQESGLSDQDIRITVVRVVRFALGFLGLVFLVLTLYAGFLWMTSAGNEDKVGKAKQILWGAVIGTAIILFSYALTQFVVTNLYEVSTNAPYSAPN